MALRSQRRKIIENDGRPQRVGIGYEGLQEQDVPSRLVVAVQLILGGELCDVRMSRPPRKPLML